MKDGILVLRWNCAGGIERGEAALVKDAEDWIEAELAPVMARLDPQLMSCFGEDFGRTGDLTVIWPLQLAPNLVRRTP